jgi:hypothetical protein
MRTSAVLALSLLALAPLPTLAQQAAPAQEEAVLLEKIKLVHQKPQELIQLLSPRPDSKAILLKDEGGKAVAPPAGEELVRPEESLIPAGIQGILSFEHDNSLVVRGTLPAVEALKRGVRVADVEITRPAKGQSVMVLSPTRLQPKFLREQLLKLPVGGTATVNGERLRLEGAAAWVDQALRVVIRSEMAER